MVREIGLHIRLTDSLQAMMEKARRLNLPFFQSFFISKTTGKLIMPTDEDVHYFLDERRRHFKNLYVHGSYWINLAGINNFNQRELHRELFIARKLEFTHIILHPGSAKGAEHKSEGIDALAYWLNKFFEREQEIQFILENTAHSGMSIGGDLQDFVELLGKLNKPERISFCIDTAHAYSYGYNIVDTQGREDFIKLLDTTIGINNIALIHLNDTCEQLGSYIDKHETIGKGTIGIEPLRAFIMHEKLKEIPVLMELPVLEETEEKEMLDMVRSWHQ